MVRKFADPQPASRVCAVEETLPVSVRRGPIRVTEPLRVSMVILREP